MGNIKSDDTKLALGLLDSILLMPNLDTDVDNRIRTAMALLDPDEFDDINQRRVYAEKLIQQHLDTITITLADVFHEYYGGGQDYD